MVAHVSDPFERQQLPTVHLPHDEEPALVFSLGEPGSLGLTVLLPLKGTDAHFMLCCADIQYVTFILMMTSL